MRARLIIISPVTGQRLCRQYANRIRVCVCVYHGDGVNTMQLSSGKNIEIGCMGVCFSSICVFVCACMLCVYTTSMRIRRQWPTTNYSYLGYYINFTNCTLDPHIFICGLARNCFSHIVAILHSFFPSHSMRVCV